MIKVFFYFFHVYVHVYCQTLCMCYIYMYIWISIRHKQNVKLCEYCMLFYRDYFDVCTTHDTPSQVEVNLGNVMLQADRCSTLFESKIDTSMPETREFFPHWRMLMYSRHYGLLTHIVGRDSLVHYLQDITIPLPKPWNPCL